MLYFFDFLFSICSSSFSIAVGPKVQNLVPRHFLPLQLWLSIEIKKSNRNGRDRKRHHIGRLTEHGGFRCPLSGLPFFHHTRRRDAWRHRRNRQGTHANPTIAFFFLNLFIYFQIIVWFWKQTLQKYTPEKSGRKSNQLGTDPSKKAAKQQVNNCCNNQQNSPKKTNNQWVPADSSYKQELDSFQYFSLIP